MEIQQLRHLLAAATSVSYAQAAKKCFTSRQNVAHSVKAIESELGVSLFERQGNGMVLTEEGKKVAPVTEEIIQKIDSLKTMFSAQQSTTALSLAVSVNLFAGVPDSVDDVFLQNSESIQFLELDVEQCYEQVCTGKVDAAVVMCMDRSFPKCGATRVGGAVAYALVDESSSLAKKSGCVASDLVDKTLILMSEPTFQYEPLFSQLDALGYDRTKVCVIPSTSTMIRLIRGQGEANVSIPSRKFAMKPPGGTVAVPIVDPRMNWGFYILYKDGDLLRDEVSEFIKQVGKAFDESEGFLMRYS